MQSPIEALRSCKYLFLHSIAEAEGEGLVLVLHEAASDGSPGIDSIAQEAMPEIRKILSESTTIAHGPGCKVFRLRWSRYIGYSVENESYSSPEPESSQSQGRLLVEFTSSVYLSYLKQATFASDDYPGPFKHWAVHCLDHIVNVASQDPPEVNVVGGA
jgi:hypothetical protein